MRSNTFAARAGRWSAANRKKAIFGWLAFVIVAFWGMLWLGDWQFHRAISGNGLSWAYTFEWPLFAIFGVVFWARTVRDEFRTRRGPSSRSISVPGKPPEPSRTLFFLPSLRTNRQPSMCLIRARYRTRFNWLRNSR